MGTRNSDNAQPLVDSVVRFGPKGTVLPTDPTSAPSTSLLDVGWLTDAGLGETPSTNTNVRRGINGAIVKTIKTDNDTSFTFETYERNKNVMALLRPGSTPVTTGATPEQQTITISGTPTGGTFPVYVPGYGTITAVFNVTALNLANALSVLVGDTVTVSLAGAVYTITFPDSMGDVGQIVTSGASLTGGTTPNAVAATTVPGVVGVTATAVKAYLGTAAKAWALDANYGTFVRRVCVPNGEAFPTGTLQDKPGDLVVVQWRLDCYPDASNTKYFDYTTNAAEAV